MTPAAPLRLLKLHGLGNDFLVLIDPESAAPIDAGLARRLCDRHTGVGADGLIRVTPASGGRNTQGADYVMELLNADGSRAETSGNGLRCLVLALEVSGLLRRSDLVVSTDAGPRRARIGPMSGDGSAVVSAGMGEVHLGGETTVLGHRSRLVDVGNPHVVVLLDDLAEVDVEVHGPAEEARHPGGINVNFAVVSDDGSVRLRTWERGAGATLACGSGSCATAAALRDWGMVGDVVDVDNPGGMVTVSFEHPDGPGGSDGTAQMVLTGPAQLIAAVEVPGVAAVPGVSPVGRPVGVGAAAPGAE
ncbi:MAG TPA: diaminopimelate epimerase [Acidimicrobiales bacterium]|nr:diaminopimelate epimerase [Acidimicrobiales bacterium]